MSPAMSNYDMRKLRETQADFMDELVAVKRLVRSADGMGGFTTGTPTLVEAEQPCSLTPGGQAEKGQADRALEVESWTAVFPWGTDVQDGDLLDWAAEGLVLQVVNAKVSKTRGTAIRASADIVKNVSW